MKEAAENCMTSCFLILTEPYYGDQFKTDELGGGRGDHVQCMGEKENAYLIFVTKPKEMTSVRG